MEKLRNIAFIDAQNLNYIVSDDGDYYKMVKFLVEEDKLCKILMPVKGRASSLYRQIPAKYRDYLDKPEIKKKVELK